MILRGRIDKVPQDFEPRPFARGVRFAPFLIIESRGKPAYRLRQLRQVVSEFLQGCRFVHRVQSDTVRCRNKREEEDS